MAQDSACSSPLNLIHLGHDDLHRQEIEELFKLCGVTLVAHCCNFVIGHHVRIQENHLKYRFMSLPLARLILTLKNTPFW